MSDDHGAPVPEAAPRPTLGGVRSQLRHLTRVCRDTAPRRYSTQVVATLLLGLTDGIGLVLLVPVVAALDDTGTVDVSRVPVVSSLGLDRLSLEAALAALVIAVVLRAGVSYWSGLSGARLRLEVVDRLRAECLDAVLRARWDFVLRRRRSDVVDAVTTGANRVGAAVDQSISLAGNVVVSLATAAVAVMLAPVLGSVALVATLAVATVMWPSVRSARLLGRQFGQRSRAVLGATTDAIDALRLVRAHDAADRWEDALEQGFADLRATQLRHQRAVASATSASTVLLVAGTSVFVLVAVRVGLPTATMLVLLIVLGRLARRFLGIAQQLPGLAIALGALDDLVDLTDAARVAAESPMSEVDPPAWRDDADVVRLDAVTFRYPNSTQAALSGLSCRVARGQVTALVGPSGAGKSTLVDLVLGLLRPLDGAVVVDGVPLTDEVVASWRARIGYVPQETVLLPGSLRHNLVWSAVGAVNDDDCWAALDRAAATFARDLPDGLDTMLGDRGVRLSGGERQRVALARALLRRPELLVLDEATSSLDVATERLVLDAVRTLCPDTTVLLVTHRTSSLAPTDRVVEVPIGGAG